MQKPDEVVTLANIQEGMVVADVGAGTGYFESRLSRAVGPRGRVLAVDIEADLVSQMKARFAREGLVNVKAKLGTPDDPGLPASGVDRILLVDTWHHLQNRSAFAQTLRKALKPTGQLVIVDYTLEAPVGPPAAMRLSPDTVIQELEAVGLRARVVPETLPNQYVIVAEGSAP
ncbi:MAG: methyltransferase domain-containing protein [Candidatus Eremiobacteraeota bacterium]|nr:methyltransferase domain-containing protein [Candidatus Eremiobacteraeota bacterium]